MKGWSSLLSAQSVVKVPVKRAADLGFMCFQPEKKDIRTTQMESKPKPLLLPTQPGRNQTVNNEIKPHSVRGSTTVGMTPKNLFRMK